MCFIRIIILAVFLIVSVQGYCIYNKHPFATLRVTQIAGYGGDNFSQVEHVQSIMQVCVADGFSFSISNFKKYIKPSNSECCPYTDKSCCTSMTKDGVIKLEVIICSALFNLLAVSHSRMLACSGGEIQVWFAYDSR